MVGRRVRGHEPAFCYATLGYTGYFLEVLMNARTGVDWRWSWRPLIVPLLSALGVTAALVTAPATLADPDQDPGNPQPPVADAPPADPAAPPLDPMAGVVPPPTDPAASQSTPAAATVAGQNPEPVPGEPPFRAPTFNPVNGSMVGVGKPIIINFAVPIVDRGMAEQAIHISSNPPVPGKFYWMNDSQVRWRPLDFWPANTTVNIDAAGTKSSFRTGDSLIATADNATHTMTVTRNGKVEQTIPMSMGMAG